MVPVSRVRARSGQRRVNRRKRAGLLAVLLCAAGLAATAPAIAATPKPVRANPMAQCFRDVPLLKGRQPLSPASRTERGWLATYSFEADYAATVKTADKSLKTQGWTHMKSERRCSSACFAKDMMRLTIVKARTAVERCPRTGRTWQRTIWPCAGLAKTGATRTAASDSWVTIECVLLEPQPSMARCMAPAKT